MRKVRVAHRRTVHRAVIDGLLFRSAVAPRHSKGVAAVVCYRKRAVCGKTKPEADLLAVISDAACGDICSGIIGYALLQIYCRNCHLCVRGLDHAARCRAAIVDAYRRRVHHAPNKSAFCHRVRARINQCCGEFVRAFCKSRLPYLHVGANIDRAGLRGCIARLIFNCYCNIFISRCFCKVRRYSNRDDAVRWIGLVVRNSQRRLHCGFHLRIAVARHDLRGRIDDGRRRTVLPLRQQVQRGCRGDARARRISLICRFIFPTVKRIPAASRGLRGYWGAVSFPNRLSGRNIAYILHIPVIAYRQRAFKIRRHGIANAVRDNKGDRVRLGKFDRIAARV